MKLYGLKNSADMYFQYMGEDGRPFTTELVGVTKFFYGRLVAESFRNDFNQNWNTNFKVVEFELLEKELS